MSDPDSDRLEFKNESPVTPTGSLSPWKLLVVDDDPSVHSLTRLVLSRFTFENRGLEILDANTEQEARIALESNADIAVVLLDVVMGRDDSGFAIVRYIREELGNRLVRIVLRTGQPGFAPEKRVIVEYDIDDYKLKTELTSDRLFVTLVASLRSYRDLIALDRNRQGLERIVEASANLFRPQTFPAFVSGVLLEMTGLINLGQNALYCRVSAFSARNEGGRFIIEAATGSFGASLRRPVETALGGTELEAFNRAVSRRESAYFEGGFLAYFRSKGSENVVYVQSNAKLAEWERRLIALMCANVSAAFDNMYLRDEIENTQKEIILTLGEVAEARSRETGQHVRRVGEISHLIAKRLGLDGRDAELLRIASPMHDVGKLAVPDSILNKPGPLTAEEFDVIKTHAQAGHDMLSGSNRELMRLAALVALEHHERYDGTGYPSGKKGTEISVQGRIVALADSFDALSSDRVYKKAWPLEQILDHFTEERGRHFDPMVVDEALACVAELTELRNQFPD